MGITNRPKLLKFNMYVDRLVFLLRIDVLQWQSYEQLSKTAFCQIQQSLQIRNNNVIGQLCSHIINDEIITGKTFTNLASVNLINVGGSSAYKIPRVENHFHSTSSLSSNSSVVYQSKDGSNSQLCLGSSLFGGFASERWFDRVLW